MLIEFVVYTSSTIFIILGLIVAIWSFIDTHRIRSREKFKNESKAKLDAANERYKHKKRIGR